MTAMLGIWKKRDVLRTRVPGHWLGVAVALAAIGCGAPQDRGEEPVTARARALDVGPAPTSPTATAPAAPAGARLNYYGGRVVSNLQVVQVLWGTGSYLPEVTSTASPSVATFYQGVLNSPYVDWLSEYNTNTQPAPNSNQVIGRGSFSTQVVITPSAANDGATIDDTNIQAELAAQIQAGALPPPTHDAAGNNNTYYAIFFPHGKQITLQGSASCVQFCAYHGTIADAGGKGEIYYGVHPDFQSGSGCELGCGTAPTAFGNVTQVASHEMVGTITDAEIGLASVLGPPLAWYDTSFAEIGDICNGQHATIVGADNVTYDVQTEFSNAAGDCVVSRAAAGNAVFDANLKVPRCTTIASSCDTGGSLILGRANISGGAETNTPNTLGGTCVDGSGGLFHSDESLDRLRISTVDGSPLGPGKQVQVDATVWSFASDALDIFVAPDATKPVWTLATTVTTDVTHQLATLSAQFTLPATLTLPAIRANWRYLGSPDPCTTSAYDDRDDLVFAIPAAPPPPPNLPPTVNAGADQTITLPASASLSGTATDDGLPNPPATVTTTWSKVSGPGTVTFANAGAKATTAAFSTSGSYTLRLTADDSALSATDDVVVTVNAAPVNKAPTVNAGPDLTITLPAAASLNGTVTDDGLPNPPATVTTTWSKVSGPGTVTFGNASAKATTAAFSAAGSYTLRLTASDSALSATDDVVVTVTASGGSGPCANLCSTPVKFTINGSFSSGSLGTSAVCYQTTSALHGGNCGNFVNPRTLSVNGKAEPCTGGNWTSLPAARNGGYCFQTSAGNQPWAYFTAF